MFSKAGFRRVVQHLILLYSIDGCVHIASVKVDPLSIFEHLGQWLGGLSLHTEAVFCYNELFWLVPGAGRRLCQ